VVRRGREKEKEAVNREGPHPRHPKDIKSGLLPLTKKRGKKKKKRKRTPPFPPGLAPFKKKERPPPPLPSAFQPGMSSSHRSVS
jgi:hypothetical protein